MEYSIFHQNNQFYIITNQDHPNFSIKKCSIYSTSKEHWKAFISGRDNVLIEGLDIFKDFLVISERENGLTKLNVKNLKDQTHHYIPFNEPAYVVGTTSNLTMDTPILRYAYNSMVNPGTVFEYNMISKEGKILKEKEVVGGYNQNDYVAERIWATGRTELKYLCQWFIKKELKKMVIIQH